jgi:hypothetical protein
MLGFLTICEPPHDVRINYSPAKIKKAFASIELEVMAKD